MTSHDLPASVTCEHCGRTNRVRATAESAPRCGHCNSALPWVVDTDNDTYTDIVERSQVPVLIYMCAPWCPPCRHMTPILEQVAKDLAGWVKLVEVEVDEAPEIPERLAIRSVPALIFMKRGKALATHVGAAPALIVRAWVEETLAKASSPAPVTHAYFREVGPHDRHI
ncbi:thioredoxin family protein [Actinopolymorpha singaporensis]|uniref:Thioredoxin 2 n=1 Tax=Actinopolymorpha singaporensis TaxID=117157 RepID=A0A1H1UMC2_9ACTN|nr:thioredoxin family protein [Actinopolymorpha singaporensis]SDS72969.1 thioredoxin 2 [Actinopolymorpha singaporensis]